MAFEAPQIYDSDEFIQVTEGEFPRTLIVVGGGVIGLEYASMAAALGSEVTVVEARDMRLQYVDHEITQALWLTASLLEDREEIANAIPEGFGEVRPLLAAIRKPDASGVGASVHPGAQEYYDKDKPSFCEK